MAEPEQAQPKPAQPSEGVEYTPPPPRPEGTRLLQYTPPPPRLEGTRLEEKSQKGSIETKVMRSGD